MLVRGLLFFIFYFNVTVLNAGSIKPDSSVVELRSYSEERIAEYLQQKSYNYDLDPKYEQNPFKRLWYLFIKRLLRGMGGGTLSFLWELVKYGLIIGGLYILGRFLFSSSKTSLLKRSDKSPDFIDALVRGEAGEDDLLKLIYEAEQGGLHAEAIRFRFLLLLRSMNEMGLINWKDYKTNDDYYHELKSEKLKGEFKDISSAFEYVVYGNFATNELDYREMVRDIEQFNDHLKSVVI